GRRSQRRSVGCESRSGSAVSFSTAPAASGKNRADKKTSWTATARRRLREFVFGLGGAKSRVEFRHRFVRVGEILAQQVIGKAADFSAPHLERFRIGHVCRLENLR